MQFIGFVLFLAAWALLGGGAACSTGETAQSASPTVFTYTLPPWLNADGTFWQPSYSVGGFGIRIQSDAESYTYAGGVDGPIPPAAVYECFDPDDPNPYIHCPGGVQSGCPSPCFEYHTNELVAHDSSDEAPLEYRDWCGREGGDGISAESAAAGPISVVRSYLRDIHDDAVESDWCDPIFVDDSLIERAFMAIAVNPRSDASCSASTIHIEDSLFQLHKFANTYKQRPGHGGFFKLKDSDLPNFVVRRNVFFMGGAGAVVPGAGQHYLPPPGQFENAADCAGNVLLFAGTEAQRTAWLADEDGADGLTNAQKLSALSYCYEFVAKPDSQSYSDFFFTEWLARAVDWKATHRAGDGC